MLRVIMLLNHFWWFQTIPSLDQRLSCLGLAEHSVPHSIHWLIIIVMLKFAISGEQIAYFQTTPQIIPL